MLLIMRLDKPALCRVLYNKKNIPWKERATQQVHAPAIIYYNSLGACGCLFSIRWLDKKRLWGSHVTLKE